MSEEIDGYRQLVSKLIKETRSMAHCDQDILHSPGTCDYCDKYPELQNYRYFCNIQFTNEEFDPLYMTHECPSFEHRPLERIERWGGNIPHKTL